MVEIWSFYVFDGDAVFAVDLVGIVRLRHVQTLSPRLHLARHLEIIRVDHAFFDSVKKEWGRVAKVITFFTLSEGESSRHPVNYPGACLNNPALGGRQLLKLLIN